MSSFQSNFKDWALGTTCSMSMTDCSKTFRASPGSPRGILFIHQPYQALVECQSFVGDGERRNLVFDTVSHCGYPDNQSKHVHIAWSSLLPFSLAWSTLGAGNYFRTGHIWAIFHLRISTQLPVRYVLPPTSTSWVPVRFVGVIKESGNNF